MVLKDPKQPSGLLGVCSGLVIFLAIMSTHRIRVVGEECCPKGLQLSTDLKSCVPKVQQNGTTPSTVEKSLEAQFIVTSIKHEGSEATVVPTLNGRINPSFLLHNCSDKVSSVDQSKIRITGVVLKWINKCCGKGERLRANADACEIIPGSQRSDITTEIEGFPRSSFFLRWFPSNFSDYLLKINYNSLHSGYKFNSVVRVDSEFNWNLTEEQPYETISIKFRGRNLSGKLINGATEIYCFDEIADGSRILLATTYEAIKCCRKGEYISLLNKNLRDPYNGNLCQRSKAPKVDLEKNGFVDIEHNIEDDYWLPDNIKHRPVSVTYGAIYEMSKQHDLYRITFNERSWFVNYSDVNLPEFHLLFSDNPYESLKKHATHNFCFDFVQTAGKVVISGIAASKLTNMVKCCPARERISSRGGCEEHDFGDWTPFYSVVNGRALSLMARYFGQIIGKYCKYGSMKTYFLNSQLPTDYYRGAVVADQLGTVYCTDWQGVDDKSAPSPYREVAASCTFPGVSSDVHKKIRPLGVVSAVLLAAGAVVVMVREETRRSAQGRALFCHAISLCLVNVLQMVQFFGRPYKIAECSNYAFAAYFFMVAANMWLVVLMSSTFLNFRKPLGELAATGTKTEVKKEWIRFSVMSLVAWGFSSILTAISVIMYHNRENLRQQGYITPTFFETRNCGGEKRLLQAFHEVYWKYADRPLGPVVFYYVPMALLTVLNTVLVVFIAIRVRSLKRGTSILRRRCLSGDDKAHADDDVHHTKCLPLPSLTNALVYVKLLLTSGVVELLLEIATWFAGWSIKMSYEPSANWFVSEQNGYVYQSVLTFVDLFRAMTILWLSTGRYFKAIVEVWEYLKRVGRVLREWVRVGFQRVRKCWKNNDGEPLTPDMPMGNVTQRKVEN